MTELQEKLNNIRDSLIGDYGFYFKQCFETCNENMKNYYQAKLYVIKDYLSYFGFNSDILLNAIDLL